MDQDTQILKNYSDEEKVAYIASIGSIATLDRQATDEEIEFLQALSESANLSPSQEQVVLQSAQDSSNATLNQYLSVLKGSELRFSLISDMIAFAKADDQFTPDEDSKIKKIASYLSVDNNQYSALNAFVDKANSAQQQGKDVTGQEFLNSSEVQNNFKSSGISSGFLKGALAFIAPIIMSRMMGRNRNGSSGMGGLLGGLGGASTGGRSSNMGGLGSIFSSLGGGKSYGSQGGLGSILGGLGGLFGK